MWISVYYFPGFKKANINPLQLFHMCCAAVMDCRQAVVDSQHSSLPLSLVVSIPSVFAKRFSFVLVALPLDFAAISCAVGYLKRQLGLTLHSGKEQVCSLRKLLFPQSCLSLLSSFSGDLCICGFILVTTFSSCLSMSL